MPTVAVLAYAGVDELDLVGVVGPLRKAETLTVLTTGPDARVETSGGITFDVDTTPDAIAACDAVVLPGGRGAASVDLSPFAASLALVRERAVTVYAVCTGLLPAVRAGLVGEGPVAFHHNKHQLLRDAGYAGAIVEGVTRRPGLVTVAGRGVFTLRPVALALELIQDLAGVAARDGVADRMELLPVASIDA